MRFLDRLIGRKSTIFGAADIAAALVEQSSSKIGIAVNERTAMRVGAVFACARVIAEGISQVPFKLFTASPDGGRKVVFDHSVSELFGIEPNDWQTPYEFMETIGLHLVLTGNFFAFKVLGVGGEVLEMLPLEPHWVTVNRGDDWTLTYDVSFPGKARQRFSSDLVWHVRGPSWCSYFGLDVVRLAREAIGLSMATEEFGSNLFSKGARPGGLLTTEKDLGPEKIEEVKAAWQAAQQGLRNAMKTALLTGGMKFEQLAMTSDEAQFIETRKFVIEDICRFFRVLPIMVGSTDKTATYASAEQMFLAHVVHTLMPWYVRIEQSAAKHLLSKADRRRGYYFKFLPNGLMRGAAKDRGEFYAKALGSGGSPAWMTQDEVRALEDMNPKGGTASELPKPTNVAPVADDKPDDEPDEPKPADEPEED